MRYRMLFLLWLFGDVVLFLGSYALAYFLRVGWIFSSDFPFAQHLLITSLIAPFWLMALALTRTFALTRSQWTLRNIGYISYACLVGISLYTLSYYFLFDALLSRLLLLFAFAGSTGLTLLWHLIFASLMRTFLRKDPPVFPVLVIGVTRESARLIERLNRRKSPLRPVAVLDPDGGTEKHVHGVPVLGKLHKLEEVLRAERITHLIQCSNLEQSLNLLSACRNRKIHYLLLPSVLGIVERDERVESLEGIPIIAVSPKEGWWRWFVR